MALSDQNNPKSVLCFIKRLQSFDIKRTDKACQSINCWIQIDFEVKQDNLTKEKTIINTIYAQTGESDKKDSFLVLNYGKVVIYSSFWWKHSVNNTLM